MIELFTGAMIVGQVIIGPNEMKTDYLTENQQVITLVDTIQEVPVISLP